MLAVTVFSVLMLAVTKLALTTLARAETVRYVVFAPVDTFRFKIFAVTTLSVWMFAVNKFELLILIV